MRRRRKQLTQGSYSANLPTQRVQGRRSRIEAFASLPFIEALFAVVLGLVLLAFKQSDLAEISWILGAALSFTRYAFSKKLEEEMEPVHTLASIVDLQRDVSISQFQEMIRIYLEISEPEFRQVKEGILSEAIERLRKLAQQKTSDELATGDYYNWLLPILDTASSGSHIWAVSMMLDAEWDDSPAEQTFIKLNLQAAKRGVLVERIFVVRRNDIPKLASIPPIKAQIDSAGKFMKPLLVEREYLENHDAQLLKQLGAGLIAFDSRVALIDASSPEGFIRGYVTMNAGEIGRLRRMFDNLRVHSREMTEVIKPSP